MKAAETQGVYNEHGALSGHQFTDNNQAYTQSGSASEEGYEPGQDVKYELSKSGGSNNSNIGQEGWGK